jgi:hypothetical protein
MKIQFGCDDLPLTGLAIGEGAVAREGEMVLRRGSAEVRLSGRMAGLSVDEAVGNLSLVAGEMPEALVFRVGENVLEIGESGTVAVNGQVTPVRDESLLPRMTAFLLRAVIRAWVSEAVAGPGGGRES